MKTAKRFRTAIWPTNEGICSPTETTTVSLTVAHVCPEAQTDPAQSITLNHKRVIQLMSVQKIRIWKAILRTLLSTPQFLEASLSTTQNN